MSDTFSVIPDRGACRYCGGTGWVTIVYADGYGYDKPCPDGCPMPELPPAGQAAADD